ncbi:MAG: hypothetical protein AB8G86_13305 [Saprospiraceae bacterium]
MNYIKNIGALLLLLIGISLTAQTATVSGKITVRTGEPMENVAITISTDNGILTATTNEQGDYVIEDVSINEIVSIVPSRDLNPLNGVSTFDIVVASKHILGLQPFDTADKYIAMDVNRSGSVTVFDLVMLRNLILGIVTEIPGVASWRFVEENQLAAITFDQRDMPEYNATIPEINLTPNADGSVVVNFVGIKVGDVNGSAVAGL